MTGRERCDRLKAIRAALAERLGVDLHQTECHYEGECRGTCPKCKQEERILNEALMCAGKVVAGAAAITASLAACSLGGGKPVSTGGGGNDLSGDIAQIDEPGGKTDTGKSGGDDIVELDGEVAPDDLDDTDGTDDKGSGKAGDKTDVVDVPDEDLTGYVGEAGETDSHEQDANVLDAAERQAREKERLQGSGK